MSASRTTMGILKENIADPGSVVAIDPKYRMRKDVDRVYVFPINPFTCLEENKRIFISSVEAIILAFFDGRRNIGEVADEISYMLDCEHEQAITIVENCLVRSRDLLVAVSRNNRRFIVKYKPDEFIISGKKTDQKSDRPELPEMIMFIPTFSCNFKCIYCYAPDKNKVEGRLDFKRIICFLDQMHDWRIPSLFLSGGDPFNFPQIKMLLSSCLERGIKPVIPTKTPLGVEMIDFIVEHKIDEMQFSVDTADKSLVRPMIGQDGGYLSRLFETIRLMIRKGVRIYTNTVVTSLNAGSLDSLIETLIDLGVKQMTFSQYARSQFRHNDSLFCEPRETDRFLRQVDRLKEKYEDVKIYFNRLVDHTLMAPAEKAEFFKRIPYCTAGKMGMVILPDGRVAICENVYYQNELMLGDLKYQSLGEIWRSERRREILDLGDRILAGEVCKMCSEAVHCYREKGKCFVRALQAFGDIRMPDPYCPKSAGGARIL